MTDRLGLSGNVARLFQDNALTPLLALTALLLGVFAVLITPREEEPQIDVTFANVFVPFPGAGTLDVENLVSLPMEQVLSEIEGVEHVYSVSRPGIAVLTVQFEVGEPRTEALVRLYNGIYSNQDWRPANAGIGPALVKPKGIDDVPIVAATLWTEDPARGAHELLMVAHALEAELKRVPGTRDVYTIGGAEDTVHVVLDPQRVAGYGLTLDDLRHALSSANAVQHAGSLVAANAVIPVQAGAFLSSRDDVAGLVVGLAGGKPVFLEDVARVTAGPDQPEQYSWFATGPAAADAGLREVTRAPAVTIAIAKKPGTNAARIADAVIERFGQLEATVIPEGINVAITRNYGQTANDKAMQLIRKLAFATLSVIVLVLVTLGWREAIIVGTAVIVTLAATLFASWAWGFTINRVSLFALIFAIGILVDDAIVVVENIHRHRGMKPGSLADIIPPAVAEVGGPTILATFTVIAALLPMAFVSGLMGPYMSPIPINASIGMLISLAVAFIVTPWLSLKLLARKGHSEPAEQTENRRLDALFRRLFEPLLDPLRGRRNRWLLMLVISALIVASLGLAGFKLVILKMLPFDNKSEIQVVVDMPAGSSLEQTARVVAELGDRIGEVAEVTDYQAYVGTAAPINFNGLVRQYYLRSAAHQADIQVNLRHKSLRQRQSHDIALALRGPLQQIGNAYGANVKIVEVPPGPPVQSPLVAEIYGIDYAGQIRVARDIRELFAQTEGIVDVDDSTEAESTRWILRVDREKATRLGLNQAAIANAIATLVDGEDVGYLHRRDRKYPVPLRLQLAEGDRAELISILSLQMRTAGGDLLPLSEVVIPVESRNETSIYHKDLLPVVFVTGDMAGEVDSPLYGMFDVMRQLREPAVLPLLDEPIEQYLINQPDNPYRYSLKWDGEWQVTYETFRDMGLAYSVGLLMIYLLVVAQFRSYSVPLVIMAPIPLTVIGVLPGNALLGAEFTATSMIGMIALAGIIVRNSILLVDFINQQVEAGVEFREAVVQAAVVRARPIVLTALAAIMGAFFILDDPIFNGLAIALIFGILVSTLLTLVVIPILYFALKSAEYA